MSRTTALVTREVAPERADAFEDWTRAVNAVLNRWPGHLGTVVLAPTSAPDTRAIVIQFDSPASLAAWEASPERAAALREADRVSHVAGYRTGQDLFAMDVGAGLPPARSRLALLTWAALVPLIAIVSPQVARLGLPFIVGIALTSALLVTVMSYVVMPRLTRVLDGWLHPHTDGPRLRTLT